MVFGPVGIDRLSAFAPPQATPPVMGSVPGMSPNLNASEIGQAHVVAPAMLPGRAPIFQRAAAIPPIDMHKLMESLQTQQKRVSSGAKELGIAKLVFGGLVMPVINMAGGMNPVTTFFMEMVGSVVEGAIAKKIIEGDKPWAKNVLTFCNRLPGRSGKPAEEMTHEEKHKALVPVSIVSAIVPNLLTATISYFKGEEKAMRFLSRYPGFKFLAKHLPENKPLVHAVEKTGWLAKFAHFEEGLRHSKVKFFGFAVVSAVVLAWLEGVVAKHFSSNKNHSPGEHFRY